MSELRYSPPREQHHRCALDALLALRDETIRFDFPLLRRSDPVLYSPPLILKFFSADSDAEMGSFVGLGSTFAKDRQNQRVARGAFQKSVDALNSGGQRVPLLFEHDPKRPIGGIVSAQETEAGLEVHGRMVKGSPLADHARELLRANAMGLSVGFTPREGGESVDGDGVTVYSDVDWMELSVTSMPANAQAVVHRIKSLEAITHAEFKSALLEGRALPPMSRRMVTKMASLFFESEADPDDQPAQFDPGQLAAFLAAAGATQKSLKR